MIACAELEKLSVGGIPVLLAGQNQIYQVLSAPKEPAFPNNDEARYSDDYLQRLNSRYPLHGVLDDKVEMIALGGLRDKMGSIMPLENIDGDMTLVNILALSARSGEWRPGIVDLDYNQKHTHYHTVEQYLSDARNIELDTHTIWTLGTTLFGFTKASREGFVLLAGHENKVIAIPSEKFIKYVMLNLNFF